jgi:exodeoxyribonuclease V alpha subunit
MESARTHVAETLRIVALAAECEAIDVQLAMTCARRSSSSADSTIAAGFATLLASRALREGHSAITFDQLADQSRDVANAVLMPLVQGDTDWSARWWQRTLADSDIAGGVADATPLVRTSDLLQFRRYFDAEARIASRVNALVRTPVTDGVPAFSIVTGGPGTGKTTHVASRLLELRASAPELRVALAAPTGKAAARLTESIRLRLTAIAAERGVHVDVPDEARTLHRLLGYSPISNRYRKHRGDPLDADLVIVDEASMVDVLMLDALLAALKPNARLMLVGDHHQLASVDAGDVLGALCRAALSAPDASPLRQCITVLTRSWRFEQQPAIGALAAAILAGDVKQVATVCADPGSPDVQALDATLGGDTFLAPILPNLQRCVAARSAEALLDALESFRLLSPEREGRFGVEGLNQMVERWLARQGLSTQGTWYHGRPVLVTANDYGTGVFNGDLGVVWRDGPNVSVHFRAAHGTTRAIAPVRLPTVETAWAMTVHKSQGSEFDDVLVVVPERESRVMNRELLYTAVTRARKRVIIVGSAGAVANAIRRQVGRTSGLRL